MPVIEAQALKKTYHTGEVDVVALDGVEVELHASEFVVLLGPSGSGKSTLLNILGGLDVPSSGSLSYKGVDGDITIKNNQSTYGQVLCTMTDGNVGNSQFEVFPDGTTTDIPAASS